MSTGPAHILLVEDDERLANLTAEYLRKNDFEVQIEPRGNTAEARILDERPDLVILDVMLPEVSGYEICQNVRLDPALSAVQSPSAVPSVCENMIVTQ